MRDKRSVDELSIEELERVLAIKRREARQQQLQRMRRDGRVIPAEGAPAAATATQPPSVASKPPARSPFALPQPPGTVNLPGDSPPEDITPDTSENGTVNAAHGANHDRAEQPSHRPGPRAVVPRFTDEPGDTLEAVAGQRDDRAWRAFVNRALLLVELVAVFGLVFIGVNMATAIGDLEEETEAAQRMQNEVGLAALPTPEPTPTIRLADVVLPGGHVILDDGGARFNEEEIPAQYRARVQYQIYQTTVQAPPETDDTPLVLHIPDLNLTERINPGTHWEALKRGVGMHINGAEPGADTANIVLAAHNDIYGQLFRYLPELPVGAEFQIQTRTETYTYVVTGYEVVEPTDVHVMDQAPGVSMVTLITCYPYGVNTDRWVVYAERVG